jgi:hypothetical protein
VTIPQREIESWKSDPDGRFTLVGFSPLAGPSSYSLGAFYPSEDEA